MSIPGNPGEPGEPGEPGVPGYPINKERILISKINWTIFTTFCIIIKIPDPLGYDDPGYDDGFW